MKINGLKLQNPVIIAPMAGVTDRAYRIILREQHPGLLYTEMLSAKALVLGNERTRLLCDLSQDEHPIGVQLFGSEPSVMAEAAEKCAGLGADVIDINMGCPVPKVVRSGDGAALMNEPDAAAAIVAAVVKAVDLPVTVKMRAGWRTGEYTAISLAERVTAAGAAAITVHGRTRDQFYSGKADWSIIGQVAQTAGVPVIGNGDVFTPDDAERMLIETGCAGVMLARGVLGNPWLAGNTVRRLAAESEIWPDVKERLSMLRRHICLVSEIKGSRRAGSEMKKHACWYTKGLPGATSFRRRAMQCENADGLLQVIADYGDWLEGGCGFGSGDTAGC